MKHESEIKKFLILEKYWSKHSDCATNLYEVCEIFNLHPDHILHLVQSQPEITNISIKDLLLKTDQLVSKDAIDTILSLCMKD